VKVQELRKRQSN